MMGFGFMGKTHTFAHKTIPLYYSPLPFACELKVICESTEALAELAKATGGFERCTTDMRKVIEADDVDIIHVCTPNQQHFPALVEAIKAGKHIYVDKPVTATLDEADQLTAMLTGYKGTAQVALQYRFFPATLHAKQLIEEGFLGQVTHFRAAYLHAGSVDPEKAVNWKSTSAAGGGVIRDLGPHVLDLISHLIGPMSAVQCVSRIWATERPSLDKPGTRMKVDVEDAAVMLLKQSDGAIGSVEVSKIATGSEDELRFEIHGQHGAIRFNLMQPNYLEVYDARTPEGEFGGNRGWQKIATVQRYLSPGGKFPGPKFSLGWIRSHVHSLCNFLQCVDEGVEAHPSLSEGLHMQRVLEAIRQSTEQQTWVDLPKPE